MKRLSVTGLGEWVTSQFSVVSCDSIRPIPDSSFILHFTAQNHPAVSHWTFVAYESDRATLNEVAKRGAVCMLDFKMRR